MRTTRTGTCVPQGKQYHIQVGSGELAPYVLLPGDPGRVPVLGRSWQEYKEVASHREFRSATGRVGNAPIAACSTGVGGPSTEICVTELANVGCHTFLRVGTTGSIQESIRCGDIIISAGAMRRDGPSDAYAPKEYPAIASHDVIMALVEACEALGFTYHLAITCTVPSFYCGQGRLGFSGFSAKGQQEMVRELQNLRIANFEMESATIMILASIYGLRAGAACVVIADRVRDEWNPEGGAAEERLGKLAALAVEKLFAWDQIRLEKNKKVFFPSLLK